jgi:hypothetical protein
MQMIHSIRGVPAVRSATSSAWLGSSKAWFVRVATRIAPCAARPVSATSMATPIAYASVWTVYVPVLM